MFEKNAFDKLRNSSHNIINPDIADNFIDEKQLNPVAVQDFTEGDNYLIRNKSGSGKSFYFKLLKFPEHLIEVEYYDNNKKKQKGWLGINHITGDNKTIYKIDNTDEFNSFANPTGQTTNAGEPLEGGRRKRKIRITRKNKKSKRKATRRRKSSRKNRL